MRYKEAIEAIKSNYPPENYTMLREALGMALVLLQEKADYESDIVDKLNAVDNVNCVLVRKE